MESGSVDTAELRKVFDNWTPALAAALVSHVEAYAIGLQSWIKATYLSGDPLKQRTANLFNSINYSPVSQEGNSVSSKVGTNVKYAAVHELGLTVTVPAHERTMSMVFGRPVDPRQIMVGEHTASYPMRAFLAPSLSDTQGQWVREMDAAASDAVMEAQGGTA